MLNVRPYEMLHVGDDREFDFESPKKIGIKSFYLDREKTENGEYIIRKLSDLEKLIMQLLNPSGSATDIPWK